MLATSLTSPPAGASTLAPALTTCVDCGGAHWPAALLVAALALLLVLAIAGFVRLSLRHGTSPAVLARWGGTCTILIAHVQVTPTPYPPTRFPVRGKYEKAQRGIASD